MRAARVTGLGQVRLEDIARPAPGDGEVLVRTIFASICGSDLHKVFGGTSDRPFPWPPGHPGHEGVGEVVHGRSASYAPGDLVLTAPEPYEAAAFAEYQVLTEDYLVGLPADADLRAMVLAQQLGTVIFALKRMWPGPPAETAAVIGAGPAGLCFTQLLNRRGFGTVVVADLSPARLRAARDLGADVTVPAGETSVVDAVMDLTAGHGADLVIEAAGHDATRAQAMSAVRVGGRIGLYGLPERLGDAPYPFGVLFRRQPTIEVVYGAQEEPGLTSFREAVAEIHAGNVAAGLVTHTYDLADVGEALHRANDRSDGAIKVCLSVTPQPAATS